MGDKGKTGRIEMRNGEAESRYSGQRSGKMNSRMERGKKPTLRLRCRGK
jgi:hypothetical protein